MSDSATDLTVKAVKTHADLRRKALAKLEGRLGRRLDHDERKWFAYGFGLGVAWDTVGFARLDDRWPQEAKESQATTWGVYASDLVSGYDFDVDWALVDAANLPRPPESELGDFDDKRPVRLAGHGLRPWWLEFTTGNDSLGYYGWQTWEKGGHSLRVAEVVDRLGLERLEEVLRYSEQALWAVPRLKEEAKIEHSGDGLEVAFRLLEDGARKLEAEIHEVRAVLPTAAPGRRSRHSALAG